MNEHGIVLLSIKPQPLTNFQGLTNVHFFQGIKIIQLRFRRKERKKAKQKEIPISHSRPH
jgi:hypothetical protein